MIRKLIRKVLELPMGKRRGSKPRVYPLPQHGVRRDQLSSAALRVTNRLQEAGYAAYVVGGAVRDLMLGVSPKDFDVATNATPEQVHHLFRRSRIIGRRFRIVHVMMGPETIEVTTFRGGSVDDTNETGRIMADNSFGSQEEDAHRRDFTVNALFYDPSDETVIDYHHGVKDLHAKKLVMIGQPARRYQEDPVRMLRAVRLAAKLGFEIDEDTKKPIRAHAHLLKKEPPARLFDELLKLLMSGHAYACLKKLREEGLARGVFPLLDAVMDDKGGEDAFLKLSLDSTDARLRADKPISVGFLLATLLWRQVDQGWQRRREAGEKSLPALLDAISDVENEQDNDFAIPRRFSVTMREIWTLQARFDSRTGGRPFRFLEQPRFRAAYDFLALRSEAGDVPRELVRWWDEFQRGDEGDRERLVSEAKDSGADEPAKKRRRRRSGGRRKPEGAGESAE
ncbi:polynucleotide adenylyltransferase PcnB [Chromobacterium phragmitis]|uniref:Poly(A) polymerase I n=1 Tax=Chromobacterium phragmitis TaxID=2202141 RepID=A0A344UMP2_9NEIS|nr:polynucleotide adenylyltransferase PcnB [Chromobacterium phragmitis]AXE31156.1 polynucleotide adenylyltransferase PcnB [Chromobacterium phragmitis]AXE36540.1 polynucleotide adenylyltransferase PcnB [Chromobacterium phragmitis]